MRAQGNGELIGTSTPILDLIEEIGRIATSDAKVLVTGESGVGKELVATAIHRRSPRAARQLVTVNCAGLPETLLESELFGHVKGSFTGAYRDKVGKLELADGGTIFLDEIGEMTLRMQGMLLRFMETGELQKVGSDRVTTRVNVRVIAATNKSLRDMIVKGTFREDLYYRLNVIHLTVPALRERREDIPQLIEHFLTQFNRNGHPKALAPDTMRLLSEYSWPGNVRELENCIERAVLVAVGGVIHGHDLPPSLQTAEVSGTLPRMSLVHATDALETDLIQDALKTSRGNLARAARLLDTTERILAYKARKLGIGIRRFRPE